MADAPTYIFNEAFRRAAEDEPEVKPNGEAAEQQPIDGDALYDLSQDGLALDLGREWKAEARHVALWGRWLFWQNARWQPDERLAHMTRGRDYLRRRADSLVRAARRGEVEGLDVDRAEAIAKTLRSATMVANVVSLARSNAELVAGVDQWDANALRIGTPNTRRNT